MEKQKMGGSLLQDILLKGIHIYPELSIGVFSRKPSAGNRDP